MTFNRKLVRQWTHREFDGVDPWAANRPVRWSIATFRFKFRIIERGNQVMDGDADWVPAESNAIPKKYAIGIYQEQNGRYRILPAALAKAWRARQVADRDLPSLLYLGEEQLRLNSRQQAGPLKGRPLVHAILIAGLALGLFGYYTRLLIAR